MAVSRGSKVASGLHNHAIQETLPHSSSTRPQILVLLLSSSSPTLAQRSGIPRWSEDVVSCEQRRDAHPWVQWSGQRRYTRRLRCCCSRWHVGGGGMSGSIGGVSHLPPLLSTFESLIPRLVARLLTVARVWGVVESYSIRRPQYLCAMSDLWKKRPST